MEDNQASHLNNSSDSSNSDNDNDDGRDDRNPGYYTDSSDDDSDDEMQHDNRRPAYRWPSRYEDFIVISINTLLFNLGNYFFYSENNLFQRLLQLSLI